MAARYIDLHTHSTASDGSDSPAELVRKAAAQKLCVIALTDHDSLDGLDEAGREAERLGLQFVRGVELAVRDDFGELHVLGLWTPRGASDLDSVMEHLRRERTERNAAILEKLAGLGIDLCMEDVLAMSGGVAAGRPHIARLLVERGHVGSYQGAFDKYLGLRASAYVPRKVPGPAEGIGLLRSVGAVPVLAHPCLYASMTPERLDAVLAAYKQYGLVALEAYHSAHDAAQVRLCVDMAARHGLLLSGGSDYHGLIKPGVRLGRGRGGLRIPFWVYERLLHFRECGG